MTKNHRLIRSFTQKIDKAVDAMASRYADGYFADEDDFTSRFLERIETELDGWRHGEIVFRVRKTTSRGAKSEEATFGADIVAVVKIDLSDYKTNKGILIQAKRLDRGNMFYPRSWNRLQTQIEKMEKHTLESYVWLYDSSGVRSIRSHAVRNLMTRRPDCLYTTKCATFLGEFVQSKHGDPSISEVANLDRVLHEFQARSAVSISASDNGRDHE